MTQSCDKNPYTNRKFKNQWTTQNVIINFDYTPIADRLRTVSWSNNSHPTGVVKSGLKDTNLPTHHKSSVINRTCIEIILSIIQTDFHKDGYMLLLASHCPDFDSRWTHEDDFF